MNIEHFDNFELVNILLKGAYRLTNKLLAYSGINQVNIRWILYYFYQIYWVVLHLSKLWYWVLEHILDLSVQILLFYEDMSELNRWFHVFLGLKWKDWFHCLFYFVVNVCLQCLVFVAFGIMANIKVLLYFPNHLRFQHI